MDDPVVMCSCSMSLALVVSAGAAVWAYKNGYVTLPLFDKLPGDLNVTAVSGPGTPLGPLKTLQKGVPPYNIMTITTEPSVSVENGALKIKYTQGKIGTPSGGAIHCNPFKSLPADSCVMSYSMFVPAGFGWNKGGKLPGICLGNELRDCATGRRWSTTGGSARLMFKENGKVIGYLYMPYGSDTNTLGKQSAAVRAQLKSSNGAGINVWPNDAAMQLAAGKWNTLSLRVTLNSPGASNGVFSVTVNGVTRTLSGVRWRDSAAVKISSMNVVTFFGGGSKDWAAPASSPYALFKDFRFSAS